MSDFGLLASPSSILTTNKKLLVAIVVFLFFVRRFSRRFGEDDRDRERPRPRAPAVGFTTLPAGDPVEAVEAGVNTEAAARDAEDADVVSSYPRGDETVDLRHQTCKAHPMHGPPFDGEPQIQIEFSRSPLRMEGAPIYLGTTISDSPFFFFDVLLSVADLRPAVPRPAVCWTHQTCPTRGG